MSSPTTNFLSRAVSPENIYKCVRHTQGIYAFCPKICTVERSRKAKNGSNPLSPNLQREVSDAIALLGECTCIRVNVCGFIICFNFTFCWHWQAYEILVLNEGWNPRLPALEVWSLNRWTTREVPSPPFFFKSVQEIISMHHSRLSLPVEGFPVARTVKNLPAMQETWFYPCVGKIEKGNGNPLQYSCLENPTDREAWWATVCGIAKSQHNRVTNTSIIPMKNAKRQNGCLRTSYK